MLAHACSPEVSLGHQHPLLTTQMRHPVQGSAPSHLDALMSASQAGIPGLDLILEFVSTQEEVELLALVDAQPWEYLAKRRVQHHGMRFEYAVSGGGACCSAM